MKLKDLLLLTFFIFSNIVYAQEVSFQMDEKSWQEDVQFLKKKVEKNAPNYQFPKNKEAFDKIYKILEDSDPGNNKEDVVYALQMLLNTLNDEGCNVPLFQKGLDLKVLPLKTYWFNEGLFVLDATNDYKHLIGEQIVKVNDTNIEIVFEKLKVFLNADNDYYKKHLFQVYGLMPSVLKTIDLGNSSDEVVLEFASGKKMPVKNNSIQEYSKLERGLPNDESFSLKNKNHKGENYWFEFLPNSKTLFVQFQAIVNSDSGDSFSEFINTIKDLIDKNKADKLIVDVRYGGGGNGFKLKSLTDMLKDSKTINKEGHLFVLTSKSTRGTLLELTSILDLNTKAVIVGEPTAEGVNTVGDIKYITLPNSGLIISLTHTLWSTSWKRDISTFIVPDEHVYYKYSDKLENKDPWLDLVMDYKTTNSKPAIPNEIKDKLIGTYKVDGRKVTINNDKGRLFLTMNRRMKSFFEIHSELYFLEENRLSSDIKDVFVKYEIDDSGQLKLMSLQWKGFDLKIQ